MYKRIVKRAMLRGVGDSTIPCPVSAAVESYGLPAASPGGK